MGVNVAETVKALTELRHTPASPNSIRRVAAAHQQNASPNIQQVNQQHNTTNIVQQTTTQTTVLTSFQSPGNNSIYGTIKQTTSSTIYAQPAQLAHTHLPPSPSSLRRVGSFR